MANRLPDIFLNTNTLLTERNVKRKQGGIFQLNLARKVPQNMNATFTSGIRKRNSKTSSEKRVNLDHSCLYRTLPLRVNRYEVPKQKQILNAHVSTMKSAKGNYFSLQKNPENCNSFHSKEESQNINLLISHTKHNLAELDLKMTPFKFVAQEYRQKLQNLSNSLYQQLNTVQSQFTIALEHLKQHMSQLRRQTGNEIKKHKLDLQKIDDEIKMYQQMANDFQSKMETMKGDF